MASEFAREKRMSEWEDGDDDDNPDDDNPDDEGAAT